MDSDMNEDACKRLWAAVLDQAIRDALGGNLYLRKTAWAWFHSEHQRVGSFLWICTILGLNPRFVQTLVGTKDNSAACGLVEVESITSFARERAYANN